MTRYPEAALLALLAAGVLVLFERPLGAMVGQWSSNPMYSHAFVVPLISLGMIWAHRERFQRLEPAPARAAALPVLAIAILMAAFGEAAAVQTLQQLAFIVVIAGIVLFLFGPRYLKLATPAILYLLFMVPFWDAFTEPLHEPFQHNSARIGIALMQAIGVPAYREGTVIALPNMVIEVARACSGVNYLIAVLALALPLAFVRVRGWGPRALLVGSAVVVSALANGLRVALIGTLIYFDVGSPLHGPFHVLHGLFVAGIGYAVIFAGLAVLEARHPRRVDAPATPGPSLAWCRRLDAGCLALAFGVLAVVGVTPSSVPVALAKPLDVLPAQLGSWTAERRSIPPQAPTTAWADADQALRRVYRSSGGDTASISIWYFSEQRQSHELVSFKVAELHGRSSARNVPLGNGRTLTANVISWPDRCDIGLFWYEVGGTPEAHQYATKLRSAWSALSSGRTHAAAIMLSTCATASRRDAALEAIDGLARDVHLGLASHWPSTTRTRPTAGG